MYIDSLIGWQWVGKRKRKRAGVAEVDNRENKGEASAMQTTIRPMEEERKKAMSRRIMKKEEEK